MIFFLIFLLSIISIYGIIQWNRNENIHTQIPLSLSLPLEHEHFTQQQQQVPNVFNNVWGLALDPANIMAFNFTDNVLVLSYKSYSETVFKTNGCEKYSLLSMTQSSFRNISENIYTFYDVQLKIINIQFENIAHIQILHAVHFEHMPTILILNLLANTLEDANAYRLLYKNNMPLIMILYVDPQNQLEFKKHLKLFFNGNTNYNYILYNNEYFVIFDVMNTIFKSIDGIFKMKNNSMTNFTLNVSEIFNSTFTEFQNHYSPTAPPLYSTLFNNSLETDDNFANTFDFYIDEENDYEKREFDNESYDGSGMKIHTNMNVADDVNFHYIKKNPSLMERMKNKLF